VVSVVLLKVLDCLVLSCLASSRLVLDLVPVLPTRLEAGKQAGDTTPSVSVSIAAFDFVRRWESHRYPVRGLDAPCRRRGFFIGQSGRARLGRLGSWGWWLAPVPALSASSLACCGLLPSRATITPSSQYTTATFYCNQLP